MNNHLSIIGICLITFLIFSCTHKKKEASKINVRDELQCKDTVIYNEDVILDIEKLVLKNINNFSALKDNQKMQLRRNRHAIPPESDTVYTMIKNKSFELVYTVSSYDSRILLDTARLYRNEKNGNNNLPISIELIEDKLKKELDLDNISDFGTINITSDFDYCPPKLNLSIEDSSIVSVELIIEYD